MTVTPADIQAITDDINTNVLVERTRQMRTLTTGALAGVNISQLGPAGTGKSLMSRAFCSRIAGAQFFQKTMHAGMPPDAVVGAVDVPLLANEGKFERNVEGYMPSAHVAFVDEWSRSNGPTLDAFLPMLNVGERAAEGNGGMFRTPLLFVVLASNFVPAADDPQFGALVDRITLSQVIDYVAADASFGDMLDADHARRMGERNGTLTPATITLDQFIEAQDQVRAVGLSPDFKLAFAKLRRNVRAAGLLISDRAFMELALVTRANAWLAGRSECVPNDLAAVEDGLWRDPEDRRAAKELVMEYQSRFVQEANARRAEADPYIAKLNELFPLIEALPIGTPVPGDTMGEVQAQARGLGELYKRVLKNIEEAEREQENVPDLRELQAELQATNARLQQNRLFPFID